MDGDLSVEEIENKLKKIFIELESKAHDAIANESDRGAVLVAAAFLDEGLKGQISTKLINSGDPKDPLFNGGNEGVKITV